MRALALNTTFTMYQRPLSRSDKGPGRGYFGYEKA